MRTSMSRHANGVKRNGFGPSSRRWGSGSGGFLTVVAGVWVTVLVVFSLALFIQERNGHEHHPVGSGKSVHELRGSSAVVVKDDKSPSAAGEESDLQMLQRSVEELQLRLDALTKEQDAVPRPPLNLAEIREDQKPAPAVVQPPAAPQQEEAPAVDAKKEYDSGTSPVPLVDPTILTRTKPAFEGDVKELCSARDEGDAQLLQHVDIWDKAEMGSPRILCFSYTLSRAHDSVKNITQTWGQRCDGYLAMSDLTDPTIPSIDIKHQGPEAYDNMWQKVRSIWIYLHKHHVHEFDYFVSGGDDLYIIVENLRKYLSSEEIVKATENGEKPIFLGRRFLPPNEKVVFNSGGAGFVLNSAALEVLAKGLHGNDCRPNQLGFWEDVNVAYCLSLAGVEAYDTRDALGRERFLPFTPSNHLYYRIPKNPDWYAKYTIGLKEGLDCCSPDAISFHYVKGDLMKIYHALLYGMCPSSLDR